MPTPTITASQATHRWGTTLPTYSAQGGEGVNLWTAVRGVFVPTATTNGQQTVFTPQNKSETLIVTVTDPSDNAFATVPLVVEATFPYQPDWQQSGRSLDDKTNESTAEDGSVSHIVKGPIQRTWKYGFNRRSYTEFSAAEAFWQWHRKTKVFWMQDYPRDDGITTPPLYRVRFITSMDDEPMGANFKAYSFVLKEEI